MSWVLSLHRALSCSQDQITYLLSTKVSFASIVIFIVSTTSNYFMYMFIYGFLVSYTIMARILGKQCNFYYVISKTYNFYFFFFSLIISIENNSFYNLIENLSCPDYLGNSFKKYVSSLKLNVSQRTCPHLNSLGWLWFIHLLFGKSIPHTSPKETTLPT